MSENSSPIKYFICGGFGGICTVLAGHPLDTIKVRLQTMPMPKPGETPMYSGTWDCFTKIIKTEGIRGLYKGITAPLTGVVPVYAFNFFGFGLAKKVMKGDDPIHKLTKPQLYVAGAFSGFLSSLTVGPGDRIKCLLQVQCGKTMKYDGMIDCAKKLYARGGIRSIFRGTVATMLRDVPSSGFFYMTYEWLQEELVTDDADTKTKTLITFISGGFAGVAHWVVAMPVDILKNRLQAASDETYPNGLRDVFKQLVEKEGPLALYKGMVPVILRAFPANAICFLGFEVAAKVLDWVVPQL